MARSFAANQRRKSLLISKQGVQNFKNVTAGSLSSLSCNSRQSHESSDLKVYQDSEQKQEGEDLKRRVNKQRLANVDSKFLNKNSGSPDKCLDDYFVNLQRVLACKPKEIRSLKLKFERNKVRQNIIKLRSIVKSQFVIDKVQKHKHPSMFKNLEGERALDSSATLMGEMATYVNDFLEKS